MDFDCVLKQSHLSINATNRTEIRQIINRIMKFKTCLFALLAWSGNILAQDFESYEAPIIEVVGKSEIEVLPDEIYLSIRITASDDDREDGYSIDVKEDSLIAGLRKIGISMDQLSLTNANSSTVQINWSCMS